jgi:hypothetical protein
VEEWRSGRVEELRSSEAVEEWSQWSSRVVQ